MQKLRAFLCFIFHWQGLTNTLGSMFFDKWTGGVRGAGGLWGIAYTALTTDQENELLTTLATDKVLYFRYSVF